MGLMSQAEVDEALDVLSMTQGGLPRASAEERKS
jgi:hypothetical protein